MTRVSTWPEFLHDYSLYMTRVSIWLESLMNDQSLYKTRFSTWPESLHDQSFYMTRVSTWPESLYVQSLYKTSVFICQGFLHTYIPDELFVSWRECYDFLAKLASVWCTLRSFCPFSFFLLHLQPGYFYQNLYCMIYSTLLLDLKISSVGVLDLGLPPLLLVPLTHRLWFWKTQSLIRRNTRKLTASTLVEWTLDSSQNCSANEKLSPYMAFARLGLKVNSCSCDWVWQGWTRQGTVWDA